MLKTADKSPDRPGQSPGNGSLRVEVEGRPHVRDEKNTHHMFSGRDALRLCWAYSSTGIHDFLIASYTTPGDTISGHFEARMKGKISGHR